MAVPSEISGSLLRSGNLILGRYELIRELGRGGMGVVWLALDKTLQIQLAVKFLPDVLRQDRSSLDELRDEAVRNLRLTNEYIVRTYDFIEGEGIAGITMEYVDGSTLAGLKVDRPEKHLETAELLPMVRQLCEALHYAHTQPKVVHRDLKPANLMVTKDGRLKVTDFGIARSISDSFSRVSNAQPTSGTLMFMSPQQLMGEPPRPSDDIYSVGATLYDLLTSKPPFFTGSIHAQVIQATPQNMVERRAQLSRAGQTIPAQWEEVIAACLAKQPENRPATALEIIRRLESPSVTLANATVEARRVEVPPPAAAVPSSIPPQAPSAWQNIAPVPALPGTGPVPSPQYGGYATIPPPPAPNRGSSPWLLVVILILAGVLAVGGGLFLAFRGQESGGRAGTNVTTPVPYVPPTPVATPAQQTGRIMVNSIPSGARVFLDGREVGSSPVTLSDVEAGDHRLRLERADYEPLDLTVNVTAGSTVDRGALALVAIPKPAPLTTTETPASIPKPQPPPPAPAPVDIGLSEGAARVVAARYISFTQTRNVAGLVECYADPVDYHDEGTLGHTKLRASINAYFRDWPYFDIDVISSDVDATSDPDVKIVKISYRYLAKNGGKVSSGVAHDTLTIRRSGDGGVITRFRQTVTDRRKNF